MTPCGGPPDFVFLQPGKLVSTERPLRVKTVLGSCVAITVRVPRLGVSVISHCVLPEAGCSSARLPLELALRYVDTTVELMVREVAGRGAVPSEIDVQIFGGAEIAARQGYAVGRRNVAAARKALAAHGLVITRAVVGGRYGRVVDFDTKSGRAFVTTLPAAATVASAILSEAS